MVERCRFKPWDRPVLSDGVPVSVFGQEELPKKNVCRNGGELHMDSLVFCCHPKTNLAGFHGVRPNKHSRQSRLKPAKASTLSPKHL